MQQQVSCWGQRSAQFSDSPHPMRVSTAPYHQIDSAEADRLLYVPCLVNVETGPMLLIISYPAAQSLVSQTSSSC